jgi:hypothetical protein
MTVLLTILMILVTGDVSLFDDSDVTVNQPKLVAKVVEPTPPVVMELYEQAVSTTVTPGPLASTPMESTKIVAVGDHSFGTGVVVQGPNGPYVITCNHVIKDMKPKDVLSWGSLTGGALVSKSKYFDLVAIEFNDLDVTGVEISDVPVEVDQTYTSVGSNSKLGPESRITETNHVVKHVLNDTFFTTGAYAPGRSGAGLFDSKGKLVGIFHGVQQQPPAPGEYDTRGMQLYTKAKALGPLLSPVQYKVTFYSGAACTFCKQQHAITDAVNDKRIVADWTEDRCPEWILQKLVQPYMLPVAVWDCPDNRKSWPQTSGVRTIDEIVEFCEKTKAIPMSNEPMAFGARRNRQPTEQAVGSLVMGKYVDDLFNYYRKYLPVGTVGKVTWVRSGTTNFNVLGGEKTKITLETVCGRTGLFEIGIKYPASVDEESKLPVRDLKFGYTLTGDDAEFTLGPVKVYGLVKKVDNSIIEAERPAEAVGVSTLFTILTVVKSVYVLLNPVADIVVGNTVSMSTEMPDADHIVFDFVDMPSIRFVSLMTFNLGIRQVEITVDKIIFKFNGSRWIKQYTFDVKR